MRRPAPWLVAVSVLLVYAIGLSGSIQSRGISSFAEVGSNYVDRPQTADHRSLKIEGLHPYSRSGYDGQFAYFIALDPLKARWYIDKPAYRFGRILYPFAAAVAAGGQPGAIPYALLGINLVAVILTVLVLARFLVRRGASAWWAALYGLFPGVMICVWLDLTEPLGLLLIAVGVAGVLDRPDRALRYAVAFGLAGLARETFVFVPILVAFALMLRPHDA